MSSKHRSFALFVGGLPQPRIVLANVPLVERLRRALLGATGTIRLLLDPDTTWRNGVPHVPGRWETIPPCRLTWVGAVITSPTARPTPHLELLAALMAGRMPLRREFTANGTPFYRRRRENFTMSGILLRTFLPDSSNFAPSPPAMVRPLGTSSVRSTLVVGI